MTVDTAPPQSGTRGSSRGLSGWIKKNKLAAGGIAAGSGFLYLSRRGGSSAPAVTTTGDDTATSPLSDTSNYGADESGSDTSGETGGETTTTSDTTTPDDAETTAPGDAAPAGTTIVVQVPSPTTDGNSTSYTGSDGSSGNSGAGTASSQQGFTTGGHFFAGATGGTITGSGSNEYGKYQIHRIAFPGRMEYWWHYTSGSASGKWTGPHTVADGVRASTVTVAQQQQVSSGSRSRTSGGTTSGPAASSGGSSAPQLGANIFYNSDRRLRYIIQSKTTRTYPKGHTFRGYESKLNKGDWGSSAGPGWIPT